MEITICKSIQDKGVTENTIRNMIKAAGKAMPLKLEVTEEYFRFIAFEACLAEQLRGRHVSLWKHMLEE